MSTTINYEFSVSKLDFFPRFGRIHTLRIVITDTNKVIRASTKDSN